MTSCSPINPGGGGGDDGNAGGPSDGGANPGGNGAGNNGIGGDLGLGGKQNQGGADPGGCASADNEDKDMDGFTKAAGDCNDCDANVNPGAIDVIVTEPDENGMVPPPTDEDCNGIVDDFVESCDDGIAVADPDPYNGAKAIDICQTATAADGKWGVLEAAYVNAIGGGVANPAMFGVLPNFGPNVNTQRGSRMLAISSGAARRPGDAGFCGSYLCDNGATGTAPGNFPQDVPGCPGGPGTDIHDDVSLRLKIRSPKNATGYSFNFKFYSYEYPEWVCTTFNDQYITLVTPNPPGSIDGNISFDSMTNPVSVNVAFFDVCAGCPLGTAELSGNGYDQFNDAGGTSWLQTQAPVTGGDEITIQFLIWDTGDGIYDSTVVADNFQWIANGGTVSVGTTPIPDPK